MARRASEFGLVWLLNVKKGGSTTSQAFVCMHGCRRMHCQCFAVLFSHVWLIDGPLLTSLAEPPHQKADESAKNLNLLTLWLQHAESVCTLTAHCQDKLGLSQSVKSSLRFPLVAQFTATTHLSMILKVIPTSVLEKNGSTAHEYLSV